MYSGKKDELGRYQWQTEDAEDVPDPEYTPETDEYALIARRVRVRGGSERTLALRSIIVQSPLIKSVLQKVLEDYPGITASLKRLAWEFSSP